MGSKEYSLRKFKRKIAVGGALNTLISTSELVFRNHLSSLTFDPLTRYDYISTISRGEQRRYSTENIPLGDDSEGQSPFVSVVEDVYVLPETGLVVTANFEIIEESAATPIRANQAVRASLSRELFNGDISLKHLVCGANRNQLKHSSFTGTIVSLIPRYQNYYHWMVTEVPKIRYLREYEAQRDEAITLLVPANSPSYVSETLELLDWPQSRVIYISKPAYISQKLLIPSWSKGPDDFSWIAQNILSNINSKNEIIKNSNKNNVYVSRTNAIERRVVNEDEVMDVLSDFNFSRHLLEENSLAENASLFANADVIIGPHGAGLSDIIFANDATLIELFGKKIKDPYERLASDVDVEYEAMYCQPESTDIVVDTDALADRVSAILDR